VNSYRLPSAQFIGAKGLQGTGSQTRVDVCGKVMLCGEYGALKGQSALASTVDCSLSVNFSQQASPLTVQSDRWQKAQPVKPILAENDAMLTRITAALSLEFGVNRGTLTVKSQIKENFGMGSSSALHLGVVAAFAKTSAPIKTADNGKNSSSSLLSGIVGTAISSQRCLQTFASGYDVATQALGGLVRFTGKSQPLSLNEGNALKLTRESSYLDYGQAKKINSRGTLATLNHFCHIFVGGKGANTKETVRVNLLAIEGQNLWEPLLDHNSLLDRGLCELFATPSEKALQALIPVVKRTRDFYSRLPSFPHSLSQQISKFPGCDQSWSFKTTGAGGEDALLVFAEPERRRDLEPLFLRLGWEHFTPGFVDRGLRFDDE
jgi:mevalonate kinase